MAVLDILVSTYKGIHPAANSNLTAMVMDSVCRCGTHPPWECNRGKHSIRINPHQRGSSVVHWARNQTVSMALYGMEDSPDGRPPPEWFFLMDDDMLCLPQHLERMLRYKLDIVTGISTVRNDPPRPNIYNWREDCGEFEQINEWNWESNKLFEVGAVGAAYMLVRRRVLEKMAEAYLHCHFERAEDKRKFPATFGQASFLVDAYWDRKAKLRRARFDEAHSAKGDWHRADCWWFTFEPDLAETQVHEAGEDVSFCWKAKQLGFKIFADPQITPGHVGEYSYSVMDWRLFLEEQKALGNWPPPGSTQIAAQEPHAVDGEPVSSTG